MRQAALAKTRKRASAPTRPRWRERSSGFRPQSFADHYSQARQFYIAGALIFELSKVKEPTIRSRMVSHLLNIDDGLARSVARGLRLHDLPKLRTRQGQPAKTSASWPP